VEQRERPVNDNMQILSAITFLIYIAIVCQQSILFWFIIKLFKRKKNDVLLKTENYLLKSVNNLNFEIKHLQ